MMLALAFTMLAQPVSQPPIMIRCDRDSLCSVRDIDHAVKEVHDAFQPQQSPPKTEAPRAEVFGLGEAVPITLIICGSCLLGALLLAFFVTLGTNPSTFERWLEGRERIKLAEIELKKVQANHEKVCPRLTDTPRKT